MEQTRTDDSANAAEGRRWTITQIARELKTPQFRLIYLCQQNAIVPDLGNAEGRGSSRGFSAKNLLEFSIAIKLLVLPLPVPVIRGIVQLLREVERELQDLGGEGGARFELPDSLREREWTKLQLIVSDGREIYVQAERKGLGPMLLGPHELKAAAGRRGFSSPMIGGGGAGSVA